MHEVAYFTKALIGMRVYGLPYNPAWQPCGDGDGCLETSDPRMIAALRAKIAAKVGGVLEVSKEEYLAKKAEPVPRKRFLTLDPASSRLRIGNGSGSPLGPMRKQAPDVGHAAGGSREPRGLASAVAPDIGKLPHTVGTSDMEPD